MGPGAMRFWAVPISAAALFGETQSRVVLSATPANAVKILASGLPVARLGVVGGATLKLGRLSWPVAQLRTAWWSAIGKVMDR